MAGDTFDAGTVYAEARLDRDSFQKDLDQLRRDMARFEKEQFTVSAGLDDRAFDKGASGVRGKVRDLGRESATPKVGINDRAFLSGAMSIRNTLKQINEIVSTPLILVDITKSLIRVSQLKYELQDLARQYIIDVIVYPRAFQEMNKLSDSLLSFQNLAKVAIPSLLPLLTAVAGGAAIAGSSLVGAGGAAGVFALAAIPALTSIVEKSKEIEDAQKKVSEALTDEQRKTALAELAQLMAGLSEQEKRAIQDVNAIKEAWRGFQTSIQPVVFGLLSDSVGLISKLLPPLVPVVTAVAGVFGSWMRDMEAGVDSGGFAKFTQWLAGPGTQSLDAWGTALGNFVVGFINILMGADAAVGPFNQGLVSMSENFLRWSQTLGQNQQWQEFLRFTSAVLPDVLTILGQLVQIFWALHQQFAPVTEAILGFVAGFMTAHPELVKFLVVGFAVSQFMSGLISIIAGLVLKVILFAAIFGRIGQVMALARTAQMLWAAATIGDMKSVIALSKTMFSQFMKMTLIGRIWGAITKATALWTAAQWLLNAAFLANPITWIIVAIVALGAAIALVIVYWDEIAAAAVTAWNAIADAAKWAWENVIKPALDGIAAAWQWLVDLAGTVGDGIAAGWQAVLDFFSNLGQQIWAGITTGAGAVGDFFVGLGTTIWDAIVGIASSIGDAFAGAWDWVVSAAVTAFDALLTFFADLPTNLGYAIGYLIGFLVRLIVDGSVALWDGLVTAFNAVVDFFVALPGMIGDAAGAFWGMLVSGWDAVMAFFESLPGIIGNALSSLGTWLADIAKTAWDGFTNALAVAFIATAAWLAALPGRIGEFLTGVGEWLAETGKAAWDGFTNGLKIAWEATVAWFEALPSNIAAFLVDVGIWLATSGTDLWNGFTGGLGIAWESTIAWFESLPERIGAFFSAAGTWLLDAGRWILEGLWNGLVAGWDIVWNWLTSFVDGFLQGFKDAMGIASPSTVFMQFGIWILEGLLNGLIAFATMILDWIVSFASMILAGFQVGIAFVTELWNSWWNGLVAVATTIWGAIQSAISAGWALVQAVFSAAIAFVTTVWSTFWNTLTAVATAIFTGIQNTIQIIWAGIQAIFQTVIAIVQAGWNLFWSGLQAIAQSIFTAIQIIIQTVWSVIQQLFAAAQALLSGNWSAFWGIMQNIAATIWNGISAAIGVVWNTIQGVFAAGIAFVRGAWEVFWNTLSSVATTVFNGIRGVIDTVLGAVQTAFRTAVDAIGTAWDRIREIVAAPIRFMVGTVYNQGIVPAWNWVADLVGMGGLQTVNLAFANGGILPGYSPGRDNIVASSPAGPVALSGGEAIMRPEWTKAIGAAGVYQMNLAARRGGVMGVKNYLKMGGESSQAFAAGGVVAGQAFAQSQAGKPYIWGGVGPAGYDCSGFVSAVTNAATGRNPHSRLFSTASFAGGGAAGFQPGTGSSFVIGVRQGNPGHMAGNLAGLGVESRGGDGVVVGGGATSVLSFPNQFFLPEIGGEFVADGGAGLLDKLMELWKKVEDMLARVGEFTGTKWGEGAMGLVKQLADGAIDFLRSELTFGLFDQGGLIQPGLNLVNNKTGRPELAGRPDQWAKMIDSSNVQLPDSSSAYDSRTLEAIAGTMSEIKDLLERRGVGAQVIVEDKSGDPTRTGRQAALAIRLS